MAARARPFGGVILMAEFLLELFSEDIPSRMQPWAAEDLKFTLTQKLQALDVSFNFARAYATPQRLTLVIDGLPNELPPSREEKRGPRVGAPDAALQGFLKGAGLSSIEQCEKRDTGKGEFWFAVLERPAQAMHGILPGLIHDTLDAFPWPKSMRWGRNGKFTWVRPLRRVLAIFDGAALALDPDRLGEGVVIGVETVGHRFMAPQAFAVTNFADYQDKLRAAFVILDPAERRAEIQRQAQALAAGAGLRLVSDDGLLDEVTGLVEWPVALLGRFDADFLDVPPEVLITSMRVHQKYFALAENNEWPEDKPKLVPNFIVIANRTPSDDGAAIIAGNERVLRARLSDAKFFWDQDHKIRLEDRFDKLSAITFHAKLGSIADKMHRVGKLAHELAPFVPYADASLIDRAALLLKADLVTGMVGEFPELQGVMGRYYAIHDGEDAAVAAAIRDHYKPKGADDEVPLEASLPALMALADKLDTLAGFFSIGEKPTGSKDPFALRRAALGVIRIILKNGLRLPLRAALQKAGHSGDDLFDFFIDRLKVILRDEEYGIRHDIITAVAALGGDDLVLMRNRAQVLQGLIDTHTGRNLLAAYNRAASIVRIESQKDEAVKAAAVESHRFIQAEEKSLYDAMLTLDAKAQPALAREDFSAACAALAELRGPLDDFFDKVTVNADDPHIRLNRLALLKDIQASMNQIADFSKIEG